MKKNRQFPEEYHHVYFTVVLSALPHLSNISLPATVVCLSLWAYIFASFKRPLPMPGLRNRSFMGFLLFLVSAATHEGATVEAFVALLISMITVKLFEVQSTRDAVIAVILCYFTIVSGMFFNDSILATTYILFALIYNTSTLTHIQFPTLSFGISWKFALSISLRAFPIMVILFLVFPRIQTGFIGRVPIETAYTGFTEKLRMGSVAELAESHKIAFRVNFRNNSIPDPAQLYWRNIVFWEYDGTLWQHGRRRHISPPVYNSEYENYRYTVTLEAHHQRWLPALDLPLSVHGHSSWLRHDSTLYRYIPVKNRISYDITSSLGVSPRRIPQLRNLALQLPGERNPRARTLAKGWRSEPPQVIVRKALDYFENNPFEYTYSPGMPPGELSENPVDYFLFTHRKGYCEHYAASFAFLMRAAGVPARLVGGYLGGQLNPYGDYLAIRQSDAHVWVEVYINNSGWQRVDPSITVNPVRLTDSAIGGAGGEKTSWLYRAGLSSFQEMLEKFTYILDLVNSRWNSWVMQYSTAHQKKLRAWLRLDAESTEKPWEVAIFIIVLFGAAVMLGILFIRNRQEEDPVAADWLVFRGKLEELGMPGDPSLGPVSLLKTAKRRRALFYKKMEHIVHMYVAIRYRDVNDRKRVEEFSKAIKHFVKTPSDEKMK